MPPARPQVLESVVVISWRGTCFLVMDAPTLPNQSQVDTPDGCAPAPPSAPQEAMWLGMTGRGCYRSRHGIQAPAVALVAKQWPALAGVATVAGPTHRRRHVATRGDAAGGPGNDCTLRYQLRPHMLAWYSSHPCCTSVPAHCSVWLQDRRVSARTCPSDMTAAFVDVAPQR